MCLLLLRYLFCELAPLLYHRADDLVLSVHDTARQDLEQTLLSRGWRRRKFNSDSRKEFFRLYIDHGVLGIPQSVMVQLPVLAESVHLLQLRVLLHGLVAQHPHPGNTAGVPGSIHLNRFPRPGDSPVNGDVVPDKSTVEVVILPSPPVEAVTEAVELVDGVVVGEDDAPGVLVVGDPVPPPGD